MVCTTTTSLPSRAIYTEATMHIHAPLTYNTVGRQEEDDV